MCCISLSVWACFAQAESDFVYKKVTSQDEIVDGGVYVLVRLNGALSHYATGFESNHFNAVGDKAQLDEYTASDAFYFTLKKSGNDCYNIILKDKRYLYRNSDDMLANATFTSTNHNDWNISIDTNNSVATISNTGTSARSIRFYNYVFSLLSNSKGNPIYIYKLKEVINIASETGYTTLCSNHALDFTDTGVKAYTAEVADNKVLLKQVTRISAQCPVILHGTKGTFTVNVTNAAPSQEDQSVIGSNALCGVTEESGLTVNGDKEYYALTEKEGKAVFAPVKQGVTIPKGKAYFSLPKTSEAKSLSIVIEDDMTTSIPQPHLSSTPTQAYTLMGTRASDSYRGIVIINGKKHLVK